MEYTNYLDAIEVDKDLCLTIAMEECAELIQAISKAKRGKLDRDNLIEEIADLCIVTAWVQKIYGINNTEIGNWFNYKRNRVVERLNRGEFKYMQDFNWEDFKNSKIAVRCKTEEDAIEFLNKCHNIGLKWCTGKDANIVNCWRIHKEFTVYICGNKGLEFHHTKSLDFIDSLRGIEIVDFISENEIALNAMNDKPSCKDCIYRGINCTNIASKYYGEKVKLEDNCDLYKKGKSSHIYIESMAKTICDNMKAIGHESTEYLNCNDDFEDITKKMHELYLIKNKNYGNSFSKQFEEYGLTSVCIRLEDKLNRLKSLNKQLQDSQNGITDVNMDDESIKDTLIDLANYSVLAIMELNKGE